MLLKKNLSKVYHIIGNVVNQRVVEMRIAVVEL